MPRSPSQDSPRADSPEHAHIDRGKGSALGKADMHRQQTYAVKKGLAAAAAGSSGRHAGMSLPPLSLSQVSASPV